MTNRITFSIIITVHNVEAYIEYCLYSILTQRFEYYEVIVVNDGCTDSTMKKVEKLTNHFNDIKILDVSEFYKDRPAPVGIGPARNLGLKQAVGDYIFFVDGDDVIKPSMLYEYNEILIEQNNPDMVISFMEIHTVRDKRQANGAEKGIEDQKRDDKYENYIHSNATLVKLEQSSMLNKGELIEKLLISEIPFGNNTKLYKRSIINDHNIDFNQIKYYEDHYFNLNYMLNIKSAWIYNRETYLYYRRDNSVMLGVSYERVESLTEVIHLLRELLATSDFIQNGKIVGIEQKVMSYLFAIASVIGVQMYKHMTDKDHRISELYIELLSSLYHWSIEHYGHLELNDYAIVTTYGNALNFKNSSSGDKTDKLDLLLADLKVLYQNCNLENVLNRY